MTIGSRAAAAKQVHRVRRFALGQKELPRVDRHVLSATGDERHGVSGESGKQRVMGNEIRDLLRHARASGRLVPRS